MKDSQAKNEQFRSFIQSLPKTEIHLHLEGLATVDTIWSLIQEHKINFKGVLTKEDLKSQFMVTSLDEFISLFINIIQSSFKTESDLNYLLRDAEDYLLRNNIFYSEIFFAPSKFVQNGFDFAKIISILDKGAREIYKKHKITILFFIDVSRSFGPENAMSNLNLLLKNPADSFIGIGLGGSEAQGPARDYADVFKKAREHKLKVVAHAGEDVGPYSIWDALDILKAQRIGHGISAIQDPKLMDYMAVKQVPVEVCPTSNLFTRHYVKTLKEHPVAPFYHHGMNVTINTDDPALFGVELVEEYMNLFNEGLFNAGEILKLIKNTHFATFMPEKQKTDTWKMIQDLIDKSPYSVAD